MKDVSTRLDWSGRLRAWAADYAYAAQWQLQAFLAPLRGGAGPEDLLQRAGSGARPVLVIPGIYENWRFLQPVIERLVGCGHPVHVVAGLGYNRGTIRAMASLVEDYVLQRDLRDLVLVAHSKGGLVGKTVMTGTAAGARISAMAAVNTPFSGSAYARYAPIRSLRAFSPADRALRLLAANLEVNARITSVYASFDPHIPGGSHLAGAANVELAAAGHFRVLADPVLLDTVARVAHG